jgi:hypothetical protein
MKSASSHARFDKRSDNVMKRLIALGLAVAAALSSTATAYYFEGPRWPTRQVPFFVNPVNSDMTEDAAIASFQAAAAAWSEQTNASIELYYAGRTAGSSITNNGVNEVFFRNATSGSQAGASYYWYDGSGRLIDADMVIWDAAYKFYPGQSGCSSSGIYLVDLATHEFGHFLGLSHSNDTTATMYPSMPAYCDLGWRALGADDRAGIEALYPPSAEPPVTPASLAAAAVSSRVDLQWVDQSGNENGFAIERAANGGTYSTIAQVGANVTVFADQSVNGSTVYTYRVKSWNDGGSSGYSNTASVTTNAVAIPGAPTSPSPANGQTGLGTSVGLSWTATGATSYDVYLGTSPNPPLYRSGLTSASTSASKLVAGTTYYWRVVARNSGGTTSGAVWAFSTAKTTKPGNGRR